MEALLNAGCKRKRPSATGSDTYKDLNKLPTYVSEWDLESLGGLGIYYAREPRPFPVDVLEISGKCRSLSERISSVLSLLCKYLDFSFSLDDTLTVNPGDEEGYNSCISALASSKKNIFNAMRSNASNEFYIFNTAVEFIQDVSYMLAKTRERVETVISKEVFNQLISTIARMCSLYAKAGSLFRARAGVTDVAVVSVPEMRLKYAKRQELKRGDSSTAVVVSVVEVKTYSFKQSLPKKSNSPAVLRDDEGSIVHQLNHGLLGRHGGELLLDWEHSDLFPYIAGLIAVGTKVYFTMLDISREHMRKLRNNEDLDEENTATIHYSEPLDILIKAERDIIIETFLRIGMNSATVQAVL